MNSFDNTHRLSKGEQLTFFGREWATDVVDAHERPEKDFLTKQEAEQLLEGAKGGRYGLRDHALLLLAFRHGLRASEAIGMRRRDVDIKERQVWVRRLKGGLSTKQPLAADELEALQLYLATRTDAEEWLFLSSQGRRMTRQNLHYLVTEAGRRAGLGHVHPHQLRHSCGHVLANQGQDTRLVQDWLGHRAIQHTVRYTRTAAERFKGLWE